MDKRAHCLNCKIPKGAWIYCKYLLEITDSFDETGETMACINYVYNELINVHSKTINEYFVKQQR